MLFINYKVIIMSYKLHQKYLLSWNEFSDKMKCNNLKLN